MTDWWRCPNEPRCPHPGVVHDVYDWGEPTPFCCVDDCHCGHAADCQIRTPPPPGFPFSCFSCNCAGCSVHTTRHRGDDVTPLELDAIRSEWLNQCGPCDYGMPEYGCTHPDGDYRPVMLRLVEEIDRLRVLYDDQRQVIAALSRTEPTRED